MCSTTFANDISEQVVPSPTRGNISLDRADLSAWEKNKVSHLSIKIPVFLNCRSHLWFKLGFLANPFSNDDFPKCDNPISLPHGSHLRIMA